MKSELLEGGGVDWRPEGDEGARHRESWGTAQAEETAGAKALRQDCIWNLGRERWGGSGVGSGSVWFYFPCHTGHLPPSQPPLIPEPYADS